MFDQCFSTLANYNKVTNEHMNTYILNITSNIWDRTFNGYFDSIHELCSHIYICDFNWLKRFHKLREFKIFNNNMFKNNYNFSEIIFENINEYIQKRNVMDQIIIEFINELNQNDIESVLEFKDSKGTNIIRKMEPLIIHMFNHQTHHRGMISLYLEFLGIENDFSGSLYKTNF